MSEESNQEQALVVAPAQEVLTEASISGPISYFKALTPDDPLNRILAFTRLVKGARFIPADYRNDEKSIAFIVSRANELSLPWTVGLQSLYMTPQGKLGTQGDVMLALLFSKKFKVGFPVNTRERAACHIVRPDGQEHEETFEMDPDAQIIISRKDGKITKLCDKDNWRNYPKNMLKWRALANCARFIATDVISGLYLVDEIEDIESTTDAPTESDAKRMEVLQQQEEKYKVGLKAPAAKEPEEQKKPVATVDYEIHVLLPTAGNGGAKPVKMEDETQKDKTIASLRAQAMANSSGMDHIVVKFDPATGERVQQDLCHAPEKTTKAPKADAPKAEEPKKEEPKAEPAKQADPAKSAAKERLDALVPIIGVPSKTAITRFIAYMSGFIGCGIKEFTAQPIEARTAALASLEYTIHADKEEFNAGPEESGKRRRKFYDDILAHLTTLWPKEADRPTIALAMELFQQWGNTPSQFKTWLALDNIELDFRPMPDVHAALRVLVKTREGGKILKLAKEHNMSVAAIVEQIETRDEGTKKPIESCDKKMIDAAIERFIKATKDRAKAAVAEIAAPTAEPDPAEKEPEPPAAEEGDDNLFAGTNW